MKDVGQSARETLAPQTNEPHQPAVSNSEQGAFTPGPWRVYLSPVRRTLCVVSDDTWICGEIENQITPIGGQALANARLIASAPDLLAALTAAGQFITSVIAERGDSGAGLILKDVQAAISKARGHHDPL